MIEPYMKAAVDSLRLLSTATPTRGEAAVTAPLTLDGWVGPAICLDQSRFLGAIELSRDGETWEPLIVRANGRIEVGRMEGQTFQLRFKPVSDTSRIELMFEGEMAGTRTRIRRHLEEVVHPPLLEALASVAHEPGVPMEERIENLQFLAEAPPGYNYRILHFIHREAPEVRYRELMHHLAGQMAVGETLSIEQQKTLTVERDDEGLMVGGVYVPVMAFSSP